MFEAQVGVDLVGPAVQSAVVQHEGAAVEMQDDPQGLKPFAQAKLHMMLVPQIPTMFLVVVVHSLLEQQPPMGTQVPAAPHDLYVLMHETPHVPPLQMAVALAGGVGHFTHPAPQKVVLVSA